MPNEATELDCRLPTISLSRGSSHRIWSLPSSRGGSNSPYLPFSSSMPTSRSGLQSSHKSRGLFRRSEYLAIPKRFSAKLSPSLVNEFEIIILSQPQRILTYRIFIPEGMKRQLLHLNLCTQKQNESYYLPGWQEPNQHLLYAHGIDSYMMLS